MEVDAEIVPYDITKENARYGVTDWSELYQCDTCCFCARPLVQTVAQQQWLEQVLDQYDREATTEAWQRDIDRRIAALQQQHGGKKTSWAALNLGYRQRVHAACNQVMTQQEADALLARSRDRIYIPAQPDQRSGVVAYNLDYVAMAWSPQLPPLCERCDACLSQDRPGLCYLEPRTLERKYLHHSCYHYLRNARITAFKQEKEHEVVV
jgi:hypothetical protein